MDVVEQKRLDDAREKGIPWKKWGPYLSERQWGTVREDYSEGGDAWNYFTHDQARSRAYRWGEDGLAGISDDRQRLCFALALWNGKDPILKERAFGLSNSEGNHGEDVKEYYFYLDSTPTHSYMKYLYKYPQAAFPYDDLVQDEREADAGGDGVRAPRHRRLRGRPLLRRLRGVRQGRHRRHPREDHGGEPGTGGGRAAPPADALVPERLVVVDREPCQEADAPADRGAAGASTVAAAHPLLGEYTLHCEGDVPLLFTENETNNERLFPGSKSESPYVKDGINDCVVQGKQDKVNPAKAGTKVAAHYRASIAPGGSATTRAATPQRPRKAEPAGSPFADFDRTFAARLDGSGRRSTAP